MNAIVITALKRPYTFVVLAILIVVFGVLTIFRTPTDIFPDIKIPVVAVVWNYNGLMPEDMSGRVAYYYERALTSTVDNIEHIESNSFYGRGIVKIFFQPGTNIAEAQTQITSVSQTVLKQMPKGITPPLILKYNASSVPVLMLKISSETITGSQLYDMASNLIRPSLVSVAGAALPSPYGGTANNVQVSLNQKRLLAYGLTATDIGNALNQQNIVLPAGDQKIGAVDFMVQTNATPREIEEFNNIPIKQVGNATVYLKDVAWVHRGGAPQTNLVLVKGHKAILMVVMKTGDVSTLNVVSDIKRLLPKVEKTLPPGVKIDIISDASTFVKESVEDVVHEMVIAALLTSIVVILFLGSWRSTLIIATSIPLAILTSLIGLDLAGQTINVMTLGGLALAVGILVDDATVMIENIDTHLEMGKNLYDAIVDAANQIVIPTFVSTLCICVVWFPLFELTGVGGWLFMPMAEAIIFAMLASFILSRTLVPTMAYYLLPGQIAEHENPNRKISKFQQFLNGFDTQFEEFRKNYKILLEHLVSIRKRFIAGFLVFSLASMGLLYFVGENFFPEIKSAELDLHMRAPLGTRIEETGKISYLVNEEIERLLPGQVKGIVNNCGLPFSSLNQAFIPTPTIGSQDCDLTISLKNSASPIAEYRKILRKGLRDKFPGTDFAFMPGDMTAKILNFGLPAPINVQIVGRKLAANYEYAKLVASKLKRIPGIADVRVQQTVTTPTLMINTRRTFALSTGLTEADIANNALATLSGSGQTAPTYWLDPKTGVSHLVNIQTPQSEMQTMNDLETIPVNGPEGASGKTKMQMLGSLSHISQTGTGGEVSHYNIMPVFEIYASNDGRDLGAVSADVKQVVQELNSQLPRGSTIAIRGQATTMYNAYSQLIGGLAMSILLVYLIIVVNFQSWLDPFVIIMALPGALAGIAWSLFITHSSISVPALTGAIMCMGTATANSILVVSFARERLAVHGDAVLAAVEAGYGRIRPVLMTALAMIIGMLPMSLSNTQNAPLGRAVMGGLSVATIATLLFVPCVFALVYYRQKKETV
ncbi:efflux RND transporter permease subunit [Commensalibacter papalotli (ex Botero et al. 2024)]|uniref:Multidrug efflux pump subunit AcrB (AcrB) (PDB:1IWG) n=1 Tax=Commensalibacter papalotli (ex Botero et al. 2024) TaxID=2972766 RepID=A0ABN8W9E1_9PROT|nr:efflux RND transporter permease subunit [Commensalibacter papalotli (ex Botero et al. 2024)]CAI3937076.1 Multidrug efflux pump subunit AcrB (AcrB) (PDB:1IWG) [Commensalibacter papalotli (ex Botero et al. 2024)]CAI3938565.1 Multidrug efflux pump subunit AcrB (AcrB) (PDB:1IWG) [Commensalibacter papalotli (ex Botero et al. 2024)]